MQRLILVTASIFVALAVSGCSKANSEPAADQPTAKESPKSDAKPVNKFCTVMDDHEASPKYVRQHKGQSVGFCCADCFTTWDKMSDAQKDQALKNALARN